MSVAKYTRMNAGASNTIIDLRPHSANTLFTTNTGSRHRQQSKFRGEKQYPHVDILNESTPKHVAIDSHTLQLKNHRLDKH